MVWHILRVPIVSECKSVRTCGLQESMPPRKKCKHNHPNARLEKEVIAATPTVLLRVVFDYAKPDCLALYPRRWEPSLPRQLRKEAEKISTVSDFVAFCHQHQLTSDHFDRPDKNFKSLFSSAVCMQKLPLIQHMVEQRAKSCPFPPSPPLYPPFTTNDSRPAPNLFYLNTDRHVQFSILDLLLETAPEAGTIDIVKYIVTQASDLMSPRWSFGCMTSLLSHAEQQFDEAAHDFGFSPHLKQVFLWMANAGAVIPCIEHNGDWGKTIVLA